MSRKHGVFLVNCFDHPRGYYYEVFVRGRFIGSFDYGSDAEDEFSRLEMK